MGCCEELMMGSLRVGSKLAAGLETNCFQMQDFPFLNVKQIINRI